MKWPLKAFQICNVTIGEDIPLLGCYVEKLVILLPMFCGSLLAPSAKVKQYENELHQLTTASNSTFVSDGTEASYFVH